MNDRTENSIFKAINLLRTIAEIGVKKVVYTDIFKDGMLQGPNFIELERVDEVTKMDVIASGGVTTKEDIRRLRDMNMYGAIIGKALYDGNLIFEELVGGALDEQE